MDRAFFLRDVVEVARDLVGATLLFEGVGGIVVETEAYHHADPAAHSYGGMTARNAVMFGPAGVAYVYRSYGLHWCLNFVAGREPGSAVLIRALEPRCGVGRMRERRGVEALRLLCSGPGRLTQALGITAAHNGLPLDAPPFRLNERTGPVALAIGPRIGLTKAPDTPWRFGLAGSPFLSRPFGRPLRADLSSD